MTVYFVGAGPGAPDLLTLRAHRLISTAPVVLVAGSLVPPEVLAEVRADALVVDTADLDLDAITGHLAAAHAAGSDVARLCSGDPSIYSAVAEQGRRLDGLGIPWEIVPGVPAFAAAAAALRQELTVPAVAQSLILTRSRARATPMPPGEELASLAAHGTTMALHLAVQNVDAVAAALLEHYDTGCPVAVVVRASWPDERVLRCRLADLVTCVREAGVRRSAMIMVGPALDAAGFCESHLYSTGRDRSVPLA